MMDLHDAHVAAFKRTEKFRFACECRYVAAFPEVERRRFLGLVAKMRGEVAVERLMLGVDRVRSLNRGE